MIPLSSLVRAFGPAVKRGLEAGFPEEAQAEPEFKFKFDLKFVIFVAVCLTIIWGAFRYL